MITGKTPLRNLHLLPNGPWGVVEAQVTYVLRQSLPRTRNYLFDLVHFKVDTHSRPKII